MTQKEKEEFRRKFVDQWAENVAAMAGVDWKTAGGVTKAYICLSISNCVDAVLENAAKLKL